MEIAIQKVDGIVIHDVPTDKIDTWVNFDVLPFRHIQSIQVYSRSKEECPFNRGNWVVDIIFDDGRIMALKLPLKMSKKQVHIFCEPLMKRWKN